MNYEIGNPQWAWLLLSVPVVVALHLYGAWANRRARKLFGVEESPRVRVSGALSASLLVLGLSLLAIACMDIRWGKTTREVPQRGLEVVFALDVSRSMLAQDAKPNRLTRAKQQIKDMLRAMAGDRVGLVVFAGEANQAVPLTNHYHDFQQKLDSVGPESVPVGGSQLGVAIQATAEAFLSKTNDHKTVVLFTDGEDQESQPIELAKKLHEKDGLRIFTVGLGDMTEGARIPQDSDSRRSQRAQFIQHNGQQVWSKLNGSVLKQIATESNAAYIPAGTKRVNMADVYHRYIANVEQAEFETAKINALIPRYQWFAFPAFVCVALSVLLASGTPKQTATSNLVKTSTAKRNGNASRTAKAAAILLLFPSLALAQSTDAQSVPAQINAANELLRQKKTIEAIEAYNAVDSAGSGAGDELQYNLASAHYRNSDIAAAKTLYTQTAASDNPQIARDSFYNLGNCHYAKSLPLAQQQPDLAIAELEQAVQQYRRALRLDRSFADARENLERARKLIKQLQQQQEQQKKEPNKQEQPSQKNEQSKNEQSKNEQSKNEQSNDGQENEQSDSSDNDSDHNPSQTDDSKESENSQQQSSDSQQGQDQKSDSSQQNPQQSDSGEQEQKSADQLDQQSDDQSKATQQQQQPLDSRGESDEDLQEPNTSADQDKNNGGKPPAGDLSAINEMRARDDPAENKPNGAMARQSDQANDTMTRQEALKLLQAVRDRDMLRRLRQQQRQRQNRVPVDKDW